MSDLHYVGVRGTRTNGCSIFLNGSTERSKLVLWKHDNSSTCVERLMKHHEEAIRMKTIHRTGVSVERDNTRRNVKITCKGTQPSVRAL